MVYSTLYFRTFHKTFLTMLLIFTVIDVFNISKAMMVMIIQFTPHRGFSVTDYIKYYAYLYIT